MTDAVLSVEDVHWTCPAKKVLDGVSFRVRPGECVALCGENGAGKTSLLRIITGLMRPDSGSVQHAQGLGMVHQHFSLVPALTVAENVFLGAEPLRYGLFNRARAEAETRALADKAGLTLDLKKHVEDMSVGERQRVEVLKALRTATHVLLLDEPTAVLGPHEIDGFLNLIETLKTSGLAVVFVSHKLHEVARIADRALVLHQGKITLDMKPGPASMQAIADAMIGTRVNERRPREVIPQSHAGKPRAQLTGASCGSGRDHIEALSLSFSAGTVTGIAGVEGNGQYGLFDVLTGRKAPTTGALTLDGHPVRSCADARRRGVRAVAADRHALGMLPGHDVSDHLRLGDEHRKDERATLQRFDVQPNDPGYDALALSGGNQQKLVFARELSGATPALLVLHEPTRGVDFLAQERLWKEIDEAKAKGAAVVVISSDLDELRALCDRVLVLYRGRVCLDVLRSDATDDRLAAAMAGLSS
jgi:general nucleoside transport system ATP-binding protein